MIDARWTAIHVFTEEAGGPTTMFPPYFWPAGRKGLHTCM